MPFNYKLRQKYFVAAFLEDSNFDKMFGMSDKSFGSKYIFFDIAFNANQLSLVRNA